MYILDLHYLGLRGRPGHPAALICAMVLRGGCRDTLSRQNQSLTPLHVVRGGYHGKEVIEARDRARRAGKFLAEGVAQIVRWIRRNDEHIPSCRRQLDC